MGGEALVGIGLSVAFGFARWRFPAVPSKIADGGLIAGIFLLIIGTTMPNIHLTAPVIVFFIVGCLCFGAAAHLATREAATNPVAGNPEKPTNTLGAVIDNSGIVTQGQRGNNEMGRPK